jgi:hypothetical protein
MTRNLTMPRDILGYGPDSLRFSIAGERQRTHQLREAHQPARLALP